MKPANLLLPAATGILGLFLGLTLAPTVRKPGGEFVATTAPSFPKSSKAADSNIASGPDDGKTNLRTRAHERVENKKPKEPRVSIPLRTLVDGVRKNAFSSCSGFDRLEYAMERALSLMGATDREKEELKTLVKNSESEMLAAEKTHIKLGAVTSDKIQMDMSAMRGPAGEIAGRTKDGIRAALPPDLAEALISAINWDDYYPTDEKSFTFLEITRKPSGKLIAWERQDSGGTGYGVNEEFKDDGTFLPADRIFPDRWKPFLKGVTILPKDEE